MDVRPLDPSDATALLPLVQGLAAHHGDVAGATAKTLARDLADGWMWGFGTGDPLGGYALVLRHARAQDGLRGVDLHHIHVVPDARRRGVARALVAAVEADARKRGCDYVVIGANVGNVEARDAYLALGYEWREPTFWRFHMALQV